MTRPHKDVTLPPPGPEICCDPLGLAAHQHPCPGGTGPSAIGQTPGSRVTAEALLTPLTSAHPPSQCTPILCISPGTTELQAVALVQKCRNHEVALQAHRQRTKPPLRSISGCPPKGPGIHRWVFWEVTGSWEDNHQLNVTLGAEAWLQEVGCWGTACKGLSLSSALDPSPLPATLPCAASPPPAPPPGHPTWEPAGYGLKPLELGAILNKPLLEFRCWVFVMKK